MKLQIALCATSAIVLLACGSTTTTSTQPQSTNNEDELGSSHRHLTCPQRVAALRGGSDVEPRTTLTLPQVKRWRAFVKPGVIASVTRRNMVIDGEEISWVELGRIEKLLAKIGKRESKKHSELVTPFYIMAEGAVAASRLNDVLKATPTSLSPRLVVRRATPSQPVDVATSPMGAGKWFPGWLKKARALSTEKAGADSLRTEEIQSELTHMFRKATKRAIGTKCTELHTAYQDAAKTTADERAAFLAKGIPDALAACKCNGVDRAYDVILQLLTGRPLVLGWLPLPRKISDPGSAANVATVLSAKQPAGRRP